MSKAAADFIEKVAGASIREAEKKYEGLRWGQGVMFENGNACAMGIASLALCNSPDDISWCSGPTDMDVQSHLGKRGAGAKSALKRCPLDHEGDPYFMTDFTAEDVVAHVNDDHSSSWEKCRRLLRRVARAERKASK